jgi:hypothetical protein
VGDFASCGSDCGEFENWKVFWSGKIEVVGERTRKLIQGAFGWATRVGPAGISHAGTARATPVFPKSWQRRDFTSSSTNLLNDGHPQIKKIAASISIFQPRLSQETVFKSISGHVREWNDIEAQPLPWSLQPAVPLEARRAPPSWRAMMDILQSIRHGIHCHDGLWSNISGMEHSCIPRMLCINGNQIF